MNVSFVLQLTKIQILYKRENNINAVDLSSSSVSSPTDGGDVELHVLECATSTFTQPLNSGLYPW